MLAPIYANKPLRYNLISIKTRILFQNIFNDIILHHKKTAFLLLFRYNRVNKS